MRTVLTKLALSLSILTLGACGGTVIVDDASSTSSGSSVASSGFSNSTTSSSSGFPVFTDTTIPSSLDPLMAQYQAIVRIDVGNTPVELDNGQVSVLVKNGQRQSILGKKYQQFLGDIDAHSGDLSAASSRFWAERLDTVPGAGVFNVASLDSAPLAPRLNNVVKDDFWLVSDVSARGQELNFEIFELDDTTAQITKLLDYKAIAAKPYSYSSAMGFDFVENADGALTKLVLVTQEQPEDEGSNFIEQQRNTIISVHFIDVEGFVVPNDKNTLNFPGNVLAQHRVNDTLYVFSQVYSELGGLQYSGDSLAEAITNNETAISSAPLSSYLASVSSEDKFFGYSPESNQSVSSVLKITAIDLMTEQVLSNAFLAMPVEGLFLEGSFLYTWASPLAAVATTTLTKFELGDGGVSIKASGQVDGVVTIDNASKQKAFNVRDGIIRLVSSTSENHHKVLILRDNNAGDLQVIGALPEKHATRMSTDHLVYSATFTKDRIIVSTKEKQFFQHLLHGTPGPTYIVDISNNTLPVVKGEINIADAASYFEILGDRHLLSVRRSGTQLYDTEVELWDIEQPGAPIASQSFSAPAGQVSSGGPIASSSANMSQTGVAVAKVGAGTYRAVVPVDYSGFDDSFVYTRSELVFLEVSGIPEAPAMVLKGEAISHRNTCSAPHNGGFGCIYSHIYGTKKTLLRGDSVYHLFQGSEELGDSGVSSFQWGSFDTIVDQILIQ